jgi:hypothetical protein
VGDDRQIQEYVERAKAADAWADTAPNNFMKWQWREIASAYRSLAQVLLFSSSGDAPSGQPSASQPSKAKPRK